MKAPMEQKQHKSLFAFVVLSGIILSVASFFNTSLPARAASGLAIDALTFKDNATNASAIKTPAFATASNNEVLLAFIATDGNNAMTVTGVSGGGLTWSLVKRTNSQMGDSEIWKAVAVSPLASTTIITAALSKSVTASMTVVSFTGADTSAPIGATGSASAASGASTVSLTTTKNNSWVFGVGNDWSTATTRTIGNNQTMVHQYLATASGDTFWVQRQTSITSLASTTITINDTAPTSDRWNLSAVEVLPLNSIANPVSVSLTTPINGNTVTSTVSVSANAVSTASGITQVQFKLDNASLGIATTSPYGVLWDTTATANGSHTVLAIATDAVGNTNTSPAVTVNVQNPDLISPSVSIINPTDGSAASGTITITAAASDNVGVVGVQFTVDGTNVGPEATTSPYSVNWNTNTTSNAYHALVAIARDAAGNKTTSNQVNVMVNNPPDLIIIQPAQNASIASTTVNISYTETGDITGVDGARFQLDGGPVMQDPTFDGSFQLTDVSPGNHVLTGFLTQLEMMVPGSDATPVNFTVTAPDTTPPAVFITSPTSSSTVSSTITITASASDNVGVTKVQFLIDGTNLGAPVTNAPYSINWNTTLAGSGQHTITAIATDAALNSGASVPVTVTVSNLNDPSHIGQWSSPISTPMVLVHCILLNTGKIIAWSTGSQAELFDPSTNTFTLKPDNLTDLLCAGQVVLTNGKAFVVGGGGGSPGAASKHSDEFTLASSTWTTAASMVMARWYPTETVLSDGRILSTAGANGGTTSYVGTPEIYNPKTDVWTLMAASSNNSNTPNYPFMFVLPDGRVAFTGASEYDTITQILDVNSQTWTTVSNAVVPGSSAVMYSPGKVMKSGEAADSGFSGPATSTAYTIDFNQQNPVWQKVGNMAFPRSFMNLTILPDDTVVVTGGETTKDGSNPANAVKAAELWNPSTGTWTTMASEQRPRLYHSIALLLPDGRVFVSGGGQDAGVPDELTAEYFSPPYLFKGARPTITASPSIAQYGSQFFVGTPDAANIASVSLIKAGAVTHFFNEDQRFVPLAFTQTAGGLTVTAPANGNYATPGQYMLFIVNQNGVPSIAPFVTLPAPFDDTISPTAPTNFSATGNIGTASLSWTAATDNVGIANYFLYRSTVFGFTPGPTNQVAQISASSTSFVNTGLSAGTYYYVITAADAAGNVSPASSQASAFVTADTQPPFVSMTAPTDGAAISGNITVSASASDNIGVAGVQFLIDNNNLGSEVTTSPYSMTWNTNSVGNGTHTLAARARDTGGNVTTSTLITITVGNPTSTPPVIDVVVAKDNNSAGTSIVTPIFSTTSSGELLLAFVSSDGSSGMTTTGVSGGGLTWSLVKRTNTQMGDSEIWKAVASSPLASTTVTATLAQSVTGSLTVVAITGVDPVTPTGATGSANAASGAPTVSLTTTRNNSWVFGVGNDWDTATTRTLGSGQTLVHQLLAATGDTFWVQRQTSVTPLASTTVTINDTAPTSDRWNFSAVEVLSK
jgi:hypothetical protein